MSENKLEKMEFFGDDMLPEGGRPKPDPEDGFDPESPGEKPADFGLAPEEDPDRAFRGEDGEVPSEKRSRGRPAVYTDDPSKTVPVKGVPKRMLTIAKNAFPGDVSQRDAFVAYLVCNCPEFAADRDLRRVGLTTKQKELVAASETSEYMALSKKVQRLSDKTDRANNQLSVLLGMMSLFLYRFLGGCSDQDLLTAHRLDTQDIIEYDKGNFSVFREALLAAFVRFSVSTREKDGTFFNRKKKRKTGDSDDE